MSPELTPATLAALFGAMAVLAALPSTSVLAVTAQAAAHGFRAGAGVAAGVVAGDLVYILVALLGLSLVSDSLGPLAGPLRVAGGLYLIWLGWRVWRARPQPGGAPPTQGSSVLTGLLITLGDQKAVLFYLGFFPAFLDLEHLGAADVLVVMLLAAVAVGGVKLVYAAAAARGAAVMGPRLAGPLRVLAAVTMVAVGAVLLAGA